MRRAAIQPRTNLHLGDDQERRQEGIGNVGGEVDLQAIEPQHPTDAPAKREMKAVERLAADERTDADRGRLTSGARAFGPQAGRVTPE